MELAQKRGSKCSAKKVFFDRSNHNNLFCSQSNANNLHSHFTARLYTHILFLTDEHGQTLTTGIELQIARHQLDRSITRSETRQRTGLDRRSRRIDSGGGCSGWVLAAVGGGVSGWWS